jgi:NAD(P)H-dependent flavin oxidoreductase YrpB (nitropropane dioxygenase family)
MKEFGTELLGVKLLKKMNHKEFLGCRYPIVASPMNRVSDLKLAIACANAGIFPSFNIFNWWNPIDQALAITDLKRDLKEFRNRASGDFLLSITTQLMASESIYKLMIDHKVSHLEILDQPDEKSNITLSNHNVFQPYKDAGIKIIPKQLSGHNAKNVIMDGIMLKRKEGAGRGFEHINMDEEIVKIKNDAPNLPMIVSGGIGTTEDIQKYLDMGCIAVGIGTLLAASEESCISLESKRKMIEATAADIQRMGNGKGLQKPIYDIYSSQNALIFSELPGTDDFNNTRSLAAGVRNANMGHIFVGTGIDYVKEIKPVNDIIQELVAGLRDIS